MSGRPAAGERALTARYALDEVLARGGVGEVWRARDLRLGRPVAVKVLHGAQADPHFRTRFRAEAQHAARLSHPNIAAVFDYGEEAAEDGDEPTPFLVMELVEGESLADLLARRGRLGVGRTLSILRQLSCALAAAHEAGVVHRDVKPANVLVRPDGVVKITDFGIAASAASAALTETGQVVGTARYLSPEQARGKRGTPASDVYALGLVGYECLAGRPAFDGPDPVRVAMKQVAEPPPPLPPDVPEQVRGLVGTATAKDPARRLPDGAALRDALDRVLAGSRRVARSAVPPRSGAAGYATAEAPPLAPPTAGASELEPLAADESAPRRRRWWPFLAAGVLLCALATVLSLGGLTGAGPSPRPVRARVGAVPTGTPSTPAGAAARNGVALRGPATPPATVRTPDLTPSTAGSEGAGGAVPARTAPADPTGSGPTAATGGRSAARGAGSRPASATTGGGRAPAAGPVTSGAGSRSGSGRAATGSSGDRSAAGGAAADPGSSGSTSGSTGTGSTGNPPNGSTSDPAGGSPSDPTSGSTAGPTGGGTTGDGPPGGDSSTGATGSGTTGPSGTSDGTSPESGG